MLSLPRVLVVFQCEYQELCQFSDLFCIFTEAKSCTFVFCEFLKDFKFLENRNNIFEGSSLKAFFRLSFRIFDFSNLASNSRYLQSLTLKRQMHRLVVNNSHTSEHITAKRIGKRAFHDLFVIEFSN